ncbi:MAG: glycosyltransferase family 2 protein [bacterium]
MRELISIIIPVFNEENNIPIIYERIKKVFLNLVDYDCEIIFVNDGSSDKSAHEISKIANSDEKAKFIEFSRNFGKESAITAGLNNASGSAVLTIDADLQHPPELIPEFLKKWKEGADVVVGVRKGGDDGGLFKEFGSKLFYWIMKIIGETEIIPHATDFRLMSAQVVGEFNKFTERGRIARGLIDWLGFKRDYIYFKSEKRFSGRAGYDKTKLFKLAFSAFINYSLFPLKLAGYLGVIIVIISGALGVFIFFDRFIFGDPFGFYFSNLAILGVANLFLIGVVLSCLGLVALYIANIRAEVMNRPLYVIKKDKLKR